MQHLKNSSCSNNSFKPYLKFEKHVENKHAPCQYILNGKIMIILTIILITSQSRL